MKLPEISLEKFYAINPETVATYLRSNGWQEQTQSENQHSIWQFVSEARGEFILLLPLNPEIPDFPDRMYDTFRTLAIVEQRSEALIFNDLADVRYVAKEKEREILNLRLNFVDGQPQISFQEAPAKRLAMILGSLQDTLDAIGQVKAGRATPFGKVAEEITAQTQLSVLGIFKGSFGIRLASAAPSIQQLSFLENPLAESVLEEFLELVNQSTNETRLREILIRLQRRSASRYRKFLLSLVDANADLYLDWGSSNTEKGGSAALSTLSALNAVEIVRKMEVESPVEFEIRGQLLSASTTRKTFEIRDIIEGVSYSGKITDNAIEDEVELTLTKKLYSARLQEIVKTNPTTGEGSIEYKLVSLRTWNTNSQPTQQEDLVS
ncbi:MAG: hypothetical protein MUC48_08200 [Leptolyngbya sp. Prado105]|jgi:hypothetical protein|nr:hypothetical protein [Leptolyngbya sp. Prado105]